MPSPPTSSLKASVSRGSWLAPRSAVRPISPRLHSEEERVRIADMASRGDGPTVIGKAGTTPSDPQSERVDIDKPLGGSQRGRTQQAKGTS